MLWPEPGKEPTCPPRRPALALPDLGSHRLRPRPQEPDVQSIPTLPHLMNPLHHQLSLKCPHSQPPRTGNITPSWQRFDKTVSDRHRIVGCKWKTPTTESPQGTKPSQQAGAKQPKQNWPHGDAYNLSKLTTCTRDPRSWGTRPPSLTCWLSQGLSTQSTVLLPSCASPSTPPCATLAAAEGLPLMLRRQGAAH